MRIAITNPYCWPQVRRGSERILHELAGYLAARGHDVTIIATHQGAAETRMDGPVRMVLFQQRLARWRDRRWLNPGHAMMMQCRDALATGNFDAIHSLSYHDAVGAALAKRRGRFRLVMHHVGIPIRKYFRRIPAEYLLFRTALAAADEHIVLSECAEEAMSRDFGKAARRIPPAVSLERFSCKLSAPDGPARLLFVGDADQERKGAAPLMQAFAHVKKEVPDAVLQFSGNVSEGRKTRLLELLPDRLRRDVEFLGVGKVEDLPHLYRRAHVTVLPAIWEAFGIVLVESLACGTPVVGCNHAGIPDIVDRDTIGRVCEPGAVRGAMNNVEGLTTAILESIELARNPETVSECRARAENYDWDVLGPQYEALYSP